MRHRLFLPLTLTLALAGAAAAPAGAQDGAWRIGDPARHARDPGLLADSVAAIGALDGVYAVLVVHHGELVTESYFREGSRSKPHNLKSASKSVLSALVGIAIAEGRLRLDQPISELLPEIARAGDPLKSAITVRHLLTMTSGLEPTSYQQYNEWVQSRDWVGAAWRRPQVAPPGDVFQYSTGNSHLLSAVLTAATGRSTEAFAQERLFDPLGARIRGWQRDPQGISVGGNNLSLVPRDMARFGQLYLNGGAWEGRQVLDPEWVAASTRPSDRGLHEIYGTYGYLWWTDLIYEGAFAAVGYGGQYIYVSPPHDAVVVVTSTLEAKGTAWTRDLFTQLRHGILASLPPSEAYYARRGLAPRDPALDSLSAALSRAELQISALEAAPGGGSPTPTVGRTIDRVHLRRGPDTSEPSLRLLEPGREVQILERSGAWLRVRSGAEGGWIHADFVRRLAPSSWRLAAEQLRTDLALFAETAPPVEIASPAGESPAPETADGLELRRRLEVLDADREALFRRLDETQVRLQTAESELAERRSRDAARDDRETSAAAELTAARERVAELERALAAGGGELDAESARAAVLEADLARSDTERRALLEETARWREATRFAETSLEEASRRLADLEAAARSADDRLEADPRIAALEAELEAARAEGRRLARELDGRTADAEVAATARTAAEGRAGELARRAAEAEAGRDRLLEALADAERERGRLAQAATAAEDRLAEVEADRDRLTRAIADAESRRQDLAQDLADAEERLAARDGGLSAAADRIAELERDLADRAAEVTDAAAAERRIEALADRLAQAEADRDRLTRAVADAESRRQGLAEALTDAEDQLAARDDELGAARDRVASLEAALESRAAAASAANEAERRAQELGALAAEAEAERERLAGALRAAENRLASRGDELSAARDQITRLEHDLARRDAASVDAAEAERLAEERAGRLSALADELRASEAERRRLAAEVAAGDANGAARAAAEGERDRLAARLAAVGDELDGERATLLEARAELAAAGKREEELDSELAAARTEADLLAERLDREASSRRALEESLSATTARLDRALEQVRAVAEGPPADKRLATALEERDRARDALRRADAAYRSAAGRADLLETRLRTAERVLADAEQTNLLLARRLKELRSEWEAQQLEIRRLSAENRRLSKAAGENAG